jgi:hypothetical protein
MRPRAYPFLGRSRRLLKTLPGPTSRLVTYLSTLWKGGKRRVRCPSIRTFRRLFRSRCGRLSLSFFCARLGRKRKPR